MGRGHVDVPYLVVVVIGLIHVYSCIHKVILVSESLTAGPVIWLVGAPSISLAAVTRSASP